MTLLQSSVITVLLVLFSPQVLLARRIVNGTNASILSRPYQVSIHSYPGTNNEQFYGGGSLIGDTWVLTAAHLFRPSRSWMFAVRVGSSFDSRGGTLINAVGLYIHSKYNNRNKDWDFALLRLAKPYTINLVARTIPMADTTTIVPDGTVCSVSGWGDTLDTGDWERLRSLDVPIVNHELCQDNYSTARLTVTDNMICAGYEEGLRDACNGDSGGPLVCNGVLTGVVSWGKGCANPKYFGVYASVANARDWIKEKTGL